MRLEQYTLVIDAFCALAAALVLVPPICYLFTTWATRRDLMGYLGATAIVLYYQQFFRTTKVEEASACETFNRDFAKRYGARRMLMRRAIATGLIHPEGPRVLGAGAGVAGMAGRPHLGRGRGCRQPITDRRAWLEDDCELSIPTSMDPQSCRCTTRAAC